MKKRNNKIIELDLCCLSQGYEGILWSVWLDICPSPFCWFEYKHQLEEYLR